MRYVPSRFNFIYTRRQNENVIYNTFSKALILLNDKEYEQFESLSIDDTYMLKELVDNGILVEETEDEIGFLKYFHYKTKFANDTLFLTIAPTLDCIFACPYCYENQRPGKMSPEIQDAIIQYIKQSIKTGVKNLNVTWYGGEPLMYFDIVESLAQRILSLTKEMNCLLKMDMVTNGYLISPKIIESLDKIGITKVQITLDGLKENHDIRRPLKSGEGTYDQIMKNLSLFDDYPIEVLIRINVDNQNCSDFKPLKDQIDAFENPNIRLYVSPVEELNKDVVNNVSDFMTTDEFEMFIININENCILSDNDFAIMDDRNCFCTSETENCYIIDELGNFYKCWDEVGREEYCCFNVLYPDNINYYQIAKFLVNDPFSDEQCKNCNFLPLCFGGCKFQKTHLTKSVCSFSFKTMKDYIERSFFKK